MSHHVPADVIVVSGNLSLAARKDIKNGTSDIWLIAFRALFEVSLGFISSNDALPHAVILEYLRQTPKNCDNIIGELIDKCLRILRCIFWRSQVL